MRLRLSSFVFALLLTSFCLFGKTGKQAVEDHKMQVTTLPLLDLQGQSTGLMITMQSGHIHAFRESTVTFVIKTEGTDQGVPGLLPEVYYQSVPTEEAIGYFSSATGKGRALTDEGEGTYRWRNVFPREETYYIVFAVKAGGAWYVQRFHIEVSLAGGEFFFRPSLTDPQFNYQVRWSATWNTPLAYPSATSTVTFIFEPRRSFGEVNLAQPFRNTFNHLRDIDITDLTVNLVSLDGQISVPLSAEYIGLGRYRVRRTFPLSEVPAGGRTYRLDISFVEDQNFLIDTQEDPENFEFWVAGPDQR